MLRSILLLCVLAMSLATPSASLSAATRRVAPAVGAVDPASIQALKDMGAFIADTEALSVCRPN